MIEISNISKQYGKKFILENINLQIQKNQTYCLLGKNGAGKSTLINLILDLIKADEGSISILGQSNINLDKSFKRKIGIVHEQLALIEELNGWEYLNLVGKLYEIPKSVLSKRITDLFDYFFEDKADLNKNISIYSTGMKKKIAFCAAVLNIPDILILDEPFSGLDPFAADQMISLLKKYRNQDRSIFLSSHDLGYIEKISTHIAVLDNKKIAFNSSIEDFTQNGQNQLDTALMALLVPNQSKLENIDWL